VQTDTARGRTASVKFALLSVAWSLGLFGLLRLNWIETHAVIPLTLMQAAAAVGLFGASAMSVGVTLACSGTDAIALCLGAIFAYPVDWRRRVAAAAGAVGLILCLNTLRIGTLGQASSSPAWFNALHLYLWPGVLTLAIAGYVLWWMHWADRRPASIERPPSPLAAARRAPQTRRFAGFAAGFFLLFLAASPLYLESTAVLALAGFVARAAAATLAIFGVNAHAAANVLWTPRGGFVVTQECISTPLIPVYLAAVCVYAASWPRKTLGVLATLPLFIALGIARMLVIALPDAVVSSPIFFVHAFYQLLLGAVLVIIAALWRYGGKAALRHALVGLIVGVMFVQLLGPLYASAVTYAIGVPPSDPQGAIAFLPAFQVGLFLALWVAAFMGYRAAGWRRFLAGLAVLEVTQVAGLLALQTIAAHSHIAVHVRDIRGWAVAGPFVIVAAVVNVARTPR
jgi:exosortase/archaeosortase family protein